MSVVVISKGGLGRWLKRYMVTDNKDQDCSQPFATIMKIVSSGIEQIVDFMCQIVYCIYDTLELAWDVSLDILWKILEFFLAIFYLFVQVLLFFRDLCIESMQTFANSIQGVINVIRGISCHDVEDFASACIVVLLWIGAVKILINFVSKKNPCPIQPENSEQKSDLHPVDSEKGNFGANGSVRRSRTRRKSPKKQNNRRRTINDFSNPCTDNELSD